LRTGEQEEVREKGKAEEGELKEKRLLSLELLDREEIRVAKGV
jgi:hypothetical protein